MQGVQWKRFIQCICGVHSLQAVYTVYMRCTQCTGAVHSVHAVYTVYRQCTGGLHCVQAVCSAAPSPSLGPVYIPGGAASYAPTHNYCTQHTTGAQCTQHTTDAHYKLRTTAAHYTLNIAGLLHTSHTYYTLYQHTTLNYCTLHSRYSGVEHP